KQHTGTTQEQHTTLHLAWTISTKEEIKPFVKCNHILQFESEKKTPENTHQKNNFGSPRKKNG
ncbi:hypothetical protein ACJBU6_07148, partial [Exserohilum turcicum]